MVNKSCVPDYEIKINQRRFTKDTSSLSKMRNVVNVDYIDNILKTNVSFLQKRFYSSAYPFFYSHLRSTEIHNILTLLYDCSVTGSNLSIHEDAYSDYLLKSQTSVIKVAEIVNKLGHLGKIEASPKKPHETFCVGYGVLNDGFIYRDNRLSKDYLLEYEKLAEGCISVFMLRDPQYDLSVQQRLLYNFEKEVMKKRIIYSFRVDLYTSMYEDVEPRTPISIVEELDKKYVNTVNAMLTAVDYLCEEQIIDVIPK